MHYAFIGEDQRLKDEKIALLRQELLPSPDAQKFDGDSIDSYKLSAEEFKKPLMALPAVALHRVIVIRNAEKLNQQHKDILFEFFKSDQKTTIVIIDAQWSAKDKFLKKITPFVKVEECAVVPAENIFAVTRMMSSGQNVKALKILHDILDEGQHPLQIMGGMVWFWGNTARGRLSQEKFEKGLLFLQEADLNIKRSRLAPYYALEVLIAKLCVLLNG